MFIDNLVREPGNEIGLSTQQFIIFLELITKWFNTGCAKRKAQVEGARTVHPPGTGLGFLGFLFFYFFVPKNSFLKNFSKITIYLIVRFFLIYFFYTHNSHFILFCIFSLSSVFNIEPLARKIVQTLPKSSILNKLFYSKLARLKQREKITPVTQDIFFGSPQFLKLQGIGRAKLLSWRQCHASQLVVTRAALRDDFHKERLRRHS